MDKSFGHNDVAVYTAYGNLAGEMIRNFLESKGIPARLLQESAGLVHGLTVGPLGEVKILVPFHLAEEATDVIDRMEAGEFELPSEDDEDSGAESLPDETI